MTQIIVKDYDYYTTLIVSVDATDEEIAEAVAFFNKSLVEVK